MDSPIDFSVKEKSNTTPQVVSKAGSMLQDLLSQKRADAWEEVVYTGDDIRVTNLTLHFCCSRVF